MEENKCLSRNWLKNYLDLAQVNLIETVSFKLDCNSLTDGLPRPGSTGFVKDEKRGFVIAVQKLDVNHVTDLLVKFT